MVWTRLLRRLVDLVPVAQLDGLPVVVVMDIPTADILATEQRGDGLARMVLPVGSVVHNRAKSRIELHTGGPVDQGDPGDGAYPGEDRADSLAVRLQTPGFDWDADDVGAVPWTAEDEADLRAAEATDRG